MYTETFNHFLRNTDDGNGLALACHAVLCKAMKVTGISNKLTSA